MPLENASSIAQLDSTWPLGLDSAARGDDHIRLLKAVLKAQFPGKDGKGFSKPITISEDDLNDIANKVSEIGNKFFPIHTVVLRMDNINPETIYGGKWQLITGDATLTFGNGAAQSGAVSGNNYPVVPVPLHGHGVGHNLSVGDGGAHTPKIKTSGNINPSLDGGGSDLRFMDSSSDPSAEFMEYVPGHTHPINGGVWVAENGTRNATIDVRGARIAINVWRRVS